MKIKYYSDKTDQYYDSIDDLKAAEAKSAKTDDFEKDFEALVDSSDALLKRVDKIQAEKNALIREAKDAHEKEKKAFIEKYKDSTDDDVREAVRVVRLTLRDNDSFADMMFNLFR